MNKKNIDYTNIIYVILLFMVYEGMFRVTGFSINTSVYGLFIDRKSTRLNSSHRIASRMPSSA